MCDLGQNLFFCMCRNEHAAILSRRGVVQDYDGQIILENQILRSSYKERRADALGPIADEGRDKLRKASGSCT